MENLSILNEQDLASTFGGWFILNVESEYHALDAMGSFFIGVIVGALGYNDK